MDRSPRRQPQLLSARVLTDPYIYVLALAPLYLLFVSSNWIFSAPQSIDPWVYHGYFRNLQEYKAVFFQNTYYGSRLSWILPGYIAYKYLPALTANYVLHLGLWYAAVFALYYALKDTASRQAGLIAAMFMGSWLYFLQPIGSDYVDGPANVYCLVCFASLTAAARSEESRAALLFAGAAFAAAVHTNLFAVLFGPVLLLYFALFAWRVRSRMTVRIALACLGWFLAGSALLTALLAIGNFLIEGRFQFYEPSIHFVRVTIGKPNPWRRPLATWIGGAWWLVPPAVVAAAALVALATRRFRTSQAGPAAAGAFLFACLMMILCEWRGLPVLQYPYYASYLIPSMFVLIGALLTRPAERISRSSAIPLAAGVLALNSIPLWGSHVVFPEIQNATRIGLVLLVGVFGALCVSLRNEIAGWGLLTALIGCHLLCATSNYEFRDRHARRESFVRISKAADTIDEVRQSEPIRFWYRSKDPNFSDFNALNAMYLWQYTMLGNNFPEIASWAMYGPGSLVVVLSSQGDLLAGADQVLNRQLFATEFVERREVSAGHASYSLSFFRIVYDYSQLKPQGLEPCRVEDCQALVSASSVKSLPLAGWTACEHEGLSATMESKADGIHVTTPHKQLGKSVKYGPLVPDAGRRYLFRLTYALVSGEITLAAVSEDESRVLALAPMPASHRSRQTALLSVEAADQPFWLITVNNHPAGDQPSTYVIRDLEAYSFPVETGRAAQPATR